MRSAGTLTDCIDSKSLFSRVSRLATVSRRAQRRAKTSNENAVQETAAIANTIIVATDEGVSTERSDTRKLGRKNKAAAGTEASRQLRSSKGRRPRRAATTARSY